jgi:LPXTG-motif cell wall-anchored protein
MWVNPLTYSISLIQHTLGLPNTGPGADLSLAVTLAFGLVLLLASGFLAARTGEVSSA